MLKYSITSEVIPCAYGVTMDPEGYLWVSDMQNDLIYKIDPYATGLTPDTWAGIKTSF